MCPKELQCHKRKVRSYQGRGRPKSSSSKSLRRLLACEWEQGSCNKAKQIRREPIKCLHAQLPSGLSCANYCVVGKCVAHGKRSQWLVVNQLLISNRLMSQLFSLLKNIYSPKLFEVRISKHGRAAPNPSFLPPIANPQQAHVKTLLSAHKN